MKKELGIKETLELFALLKALKELFVAFKGSAVLSALHPAWKALMAAQLAVEDIDQVIPELLDLDEEEKIRVKKELQEIVGSDYPIDENWIELTKTLLQSSVTLVTLFKGGSFPSLRG